MARKKSVNNGITKAEKVRFLELLSEKEGEIISGPRHIGDDDGNPKDEIDLVLSAIARESAALLANGQYQLLQMVRSAQQRLKNGGFGRCTGCGYKIPKNRLQAVPWAELCFSCQRRAEEMVPKNRESISLSAGK